MNRELRDKWVAALRSGEYKQTTGSLMNELGFCCLGVYCVVADKPISGLGDDYDWLENEEIPTTVLWHMNDQEKLTFPEIADYIEQNL